MTTILQSPNLIDRILEDYKQCGLEGEDTNKLLAYLLALSRKEERKIELREEMELAELRQAIGVSQAALVKQLEVLQPAIAKLENRNDGVT